ncbi:hypothetical protein LTR36_007133 [Oleoguttula mirabilis]|uniref:Meiotically up-regulated gene 190 protein n=1 Tax=Oleoguttula mirabilis TaxID=1507867 RepID=A0AAV9JAF3_9PEZI|nr:hypothetical protein LTR36_007133 [Oleoguttula mirabilis]
MSGTDDANEARRNYNAPYTPHHTIPTIQKYREEQENRKQTAGGADADGENASESRGQQAKDAWDGYWQGDQESGKAQEEQSGLQNGSGDGGRREGEDEDSDDTDDYADEEPAPDTSEGDPSARDPKQRRKGMKNKNKKDDRAERQVTDPVTHLPVTIHDFTSKALKDVPENDPPFGTTERSATGMSNKNKSNKQLQKEEHEMEQGRESMQALFPPPSYEAIRQELLEINKTGVTVGLVGTAAILVLAVGLERLFRLERLPTSKPGQDKARWFMSIAVWLALSTMSVGAIWALIMGVRGWMAKRMDATWEDEIWEANRNSGKREAKAHETESVTWLNSLLGSVWPLVNPDLFTSLADTLEDVMQASLPSLVQMVSVDDIGQGSESLRILGIKWLPTGAAARSVSSDGNLKSADDSKHESDRKVPGEGEVQDTDDKNKNESKDDKDEEQEKSDDGAEKEIAEGMEAEEGDFINLEVAFAYRTRSQKSTFNERQKDMHLYLAFYLPGNIKFPVWVDVRGIVGTMRLRLQLAPDPPFFALCTLTFLGQPKVDISCIPLMKRGLNIMDLPVISNFVQSSVDAAMAEYVAPKSLTLDLKDMIAGDDFKKDTGARGVLVVRIRRGYDFEMGDPGIPLIKDGSADPYVSVGWAKFGKAMFSTRVLAKEMEPYWEETAYLLITPEELNVDERLRVQLWDSDRFTADDDLGRIELDLKGLMKGQETNGQMHKRTDGFRALKAGENMPGKLEWEVGYFSKVRIQSCQLQQQSYDPDVRSMEKLEQKVDDTCKRKLREASIKDGGSSDHQELEQQKAQEMKSRQDAMIISAPPPKGYPSGIFSIQIHQITGLELESTNKKNADKDDEADDEAEAGDGLPSAYCTVIINHSKVFKTRTKPKNSKPFFNAGVERFIPDWRNAECYVSVRDARVKEDNPLLGIVHLPLGEVFKDRSQINGFYPLMGGVGFGRIRLSMVWRSVQLQAPPRNLGWKYGTLEVQSDVSAADVPKELQQMKLRFHTDLGYAKMYPNKDESWASRKQKSLRLPVKKRYGSCLSLQFRHHGLVKDKTAAFAVLWLRAIPDEQEQELTLPVWKGDYDRAIACSLDECGEKVGSITVKLTFWSGLGGAHSKWASKDPNLQDVVEVLDCGRDNVEDLQTAKEAGIVDEDDTSSSDADSSSSDDDEAVVKAEGRPDGEIHSAGGARVEGGDGEVERERSNGDTGKSKQSIVDSAKEYKKHMKSEHRRHRGVMQWKVPRTAEFAVHKAERAGAKVAGIFKHHAREPGIQTEV